MYLGASTTIGGIRVGFIKSFKNEIRNKEFNDFVEKVNKDIELLIKDLFYAKGYNSKNKKDIQNIDIENDKELILFKTIINRAYDKIEKSLYAKDYGISTRRYLTNIVFELQEVININFPNYKRTIKKESFLSKIIKLVFIVLCIFLLVSFVAAIVS